MPSVKVLGLCQGRLSTYSASCDGMLELSVGKGSLVLACIGSNFCRF